MKTERRQCRHDAAYYLTSYEADGRVEDVHYCPECDMTLGGTVSLPVVHPDAKDAARGMEMLFVVFAWAVVATVVWLVLS